MNKELRKLKKLTPQINWMNKIWNLIIKNLKGIMIVMETKKKKII